jgi:hypothetical protein
MIAFAALLLAVAPAPAKASVAGNYETHQMEMAGALELKRDGHFRYAFSYGALDEEAAGDWSFDGRAVHLTSNPVPKAAGFELVRDDPAPKGELYLKLEDPGFEWGHPLYALATDMKQTFEIEADEDGRVDLAGKPTVLAIAPMIPVFGPTRDTFKLAADRGHRLLFRFHRNDLGKADFRDERLDIGPKGLLMKRYDAEIRFIRVRP